MSDLDLQRSLEIAAERGGDIYPAIYDAYFARCAGSHELMRLTDPYMRGRMLDSVFQVLMGESAAEQHGYLRFETTTHATYGVQSHMYENLLTAVRDVVRAACGDDWSAGMAAAWDARLAGILEEIHSVLATIA